MSNRRYALVDCNNFFVSCERIFRPELWHRPVAVLSNNDGCIVARSNEVKALGVGMGVPLFQVRRIVDDNKVTLFSANFELYGDISQRIVSILREETPLVEVYSIDECFLDLSQLPGLQPEVWAQRLQQRLLAEVGVPVSIGVAPTKTLAKVASTHAKQHGGVSVIANEADRRRVLSELPVQEVWGVGWRLGPRLRDRGVSTALQLADAGDAWLRRQFNISGMRMVYELRGLAQLAFGDQHDARATIMRSRSFGHTVRAYHQLEGAVATFAAQAAARLRAQDSVCKGVVTYLASHKTGSGASRLTTLTRLSEATADTGRLITAALAGLETLFDSESAYKKAGVTLVGITSRQAWQLAMVDADAQRDRRDGLMQAMDTLNRRYGPVVWHAVERPRDADWHSQRQRRSPRYTTQWGELPVLGCGASLLHRNN